MTETPCRDVPLAEWTAALTAARDEGFDFFDWLTAVDETDAEESPGFDIVCHLMNSSTGRGALARVLVRTRVPDGQSPASATGLWRGAAWHERETYEMFGIDFDGFADGTGLGIRPLLLPEGFDGTPLPLSWPHVRARRGPEPKSPARALAVMTAQRRATSPAVARSRHRACPTPHGDRDEPCP
jgi:NADH-quinone oxidoreductase subunit C